MKIIARFITGMALALGASMAHAEIKPFEADSMERIIASQKGKPFVLVVWSLDCQYCLASLSTLAKEKRKRKDLNVVTVATDALDDTQSAALMKRKLEMSGLTGNAWAFSASPPEQLRYAIDPKWHGEMPRSYWFNARGEKLAHSGVITAETVSKLTAK